MAQLGLGTRCVQAGYSPKNGEPRQIPIIQSTTFKYESSAEMGRLFLFPPAKPDERRRRGAYRRA